MFKKNIAFIVIFVAIIGIIFLDYSMRKDKNVDSNKIAESNVEDIESDDNANQEKINNDQTTQIAQSEEKKEDVKPSQTPEVNKYKAAVFIGKVYSTSKNDINESKYDDYLLAEDGKKYGLVASAGIQITEILNIINEVIVGYRDSGRTVSIKGVLIDPAQDVGERQIWVEEVKEITN